MDYKEYIMKEPNTEPIMNFMHTYKANWKSHVLTMPSPGIPFQMLRHQLNEKKISQEDTCNGGI